MPILVIGVTSTKRYAIIIVSGGTEETPAESKFQSGEYIMRYSYLTLSLCIILLLNGCGSAVDERGNTILTATAADVVQPEDPYGLAASFQEGHIAVSDENSGDTLTEIPLSEDEYALFLSMTDDNCGCLLYCSSPAAGIMMKHLYITKDRWTTYEEKDISSLIDGYPTSMSALSTEHIYIGTQMRSNGYLFETTDGGGQWNPVTADNGHYRYGYVLPVTEDGHTLYALLEYSDYGRERLRSLQTHRRLGSMGKNRQFCTGRFQRTADILCPGRRSVHCGYA